jgi:hypothetical protein
MVTTPSWLEIQRSMFKCKTKSFNILGSTRKLLFSIYFYDEISTRFNIINDELCS